MRIATKLSHCEFTGLWSLIFAIILPATGCQQYLEDGEGDLQSQKQESKAVKPISHPAAELDDIIKTLWDKDEKVREKGLERLSKFRRDVDEPESAVGIKALQAAARPYPFEKPKRDEVSAELVGVAEVNPLPEYIPVVVELFHKFADDAKSYAQSHPHPD